MAEYLDDEHQGVEEDDRAEELLDVLAPMLPRPFDVVGDERYDSEREGDVEVGRRRRKARNEAEQIRHQDEDEEAREQRHVTLRAVADYALCEAADRFDEHFRDVAQRDAVLGLDRGFRDGQATMDDGGEDQDERRDQRGGQEVLGPRKESNPRE